MKMKLLTNVSTAAYIAATNAMKVITDSVNKMVNEENGEFVGNIAWMAVVAAGAIAVALVIIASISALGGRIDGDVDLLAP